MEAYYHNDPRIGEWIGQIIEEIFTTCLLSGAASDVEFQKGSQYVAKLAFLLQELSPFPSEYLADGLKQIIEQKLPDSRVINNFPTYKDTMNKMIHEGILKVFDTTDSNYLEASQITEIVDSVPALATIDNKESVFYKKTTMEEIVPTELFVEDIDNKSPSIPLAGQDQDPSLEMQNNAERLTSVLSYMFPNTPVLWNTTISGQKVFAQVENILICFNDLLQSDIIEKLKTQDWKVLNLNNEDLFYPRRLERRLRSLIRLGKKS